MQGKRSAMLDEWDVISDEAGKRILSAVAWAHPQELETAQLFGEVLVVDDVFGTNSRKRPFFDCITVDGNGRNVLVVETLLLNETRNSFLWVFQEAIPEILGRPFCARVNVIIADGDIWQKEVILSQIGEGSVFPSARFRTCAWHLVTLKLKGF